MSSSSLSSKRESEQSRATPSGLFFWVCYVLGACVLTFGIWTMVQNRGATHPIYSAFFAFGTNVVHDAIIAPIAFAIGYAMTRVVPIHYRSLITWGMCTSAVTLAVAYPAIRGFGRKADNPTVLPLNYATSTLTALGIIWAIVLGVLVFRLIRKRVAHS